MRLRDVRSTATRFTRLFRRARRSSDPSLTAEQERALDASRALGSGTYQAALLHGVTGSGKTELYLRLDRGPASGPRRAAARAGDRADAGGGRVPSGVRRSLAIQHSGLSDGERHDQWHRIRRGDVDVVVGTRSAVFAPLAVDRAHRRRRGARRLFKQEESPRYNGRDVAVMRARRRARWSSWARRRRRWRAIRTRRTATTRRLVTLERRVLDRPLADVRIVDMREELRPGPDVVLSPARRRAADARRRRAGDRAAQPPRVRAARVLPPVRVHARVPELQRLADRAPRGAGRARCHYCELRDRRPNVPAACGGLTSSARVRHRARGRDPRRFPARASRAVTATPCAAAAPSRRVLRGSPPRDRRAGRHADDRQGARLPAR